MTVLTVLSIISLMTGVYGGLMTETEVHLKIYAPSGFVRNGSEVYYNKDRVVSVNASQMKYQLNVVEFGESYRDVSSL